MAKTIAEIRQEVIERVRSARAAIAKYYDPVSGNSWNGRGKRPGWLSEKEARGIDRRDFLVASRKLNEATVPKNRYLDCRQCCSLANCKSPLNL